MLFFLLAGVAAYVYLQQKNELKTNSVAPVIGGSVHVSVPNTIRGERYVETKTEKIEDTFVMPAGKNLPSPVEPETKVGKNYGTTSITRQIETAAAKTKGGLRTTPQE